ncbi:hypothetical protein CPC08DRAFT_760993 [Agrocybe pediades]|nr:hypothetical protein CPC08DRAFT_760993 [Agrocybe pediades]
MPHSSTNHSYEASDPQSTLVHSRNLSTVSSATLHTNTTLHSQPYEPLLRPISPGSGEYYDVVSQQSRQQSDRILSLPRWSQSNVLSRHSTPHDEKSSYPSERRFKKRINVLRLSKNILQGIMAIWAIYSTARYLLAFTIYQSAMGQIFALVMGVSTGLSFTFSSCSAILYAGQTHLLVHGFSVQALISLRRTLHYLSSLCLFGPSLVNVALIFLWKGTPDLELQTRLRCGLDVDLVWSAKYRLCGQKNKTWGFWVTLSLLRFFLTLIIIIAFHRITSSPYFAPPRKNQKPRYMSGKKSHARLASCQSPLMHGDSATSVVMPHLSSDQIQQRQSSESTLSGKSSSPRNRLRPSRSHTPAISEEAEAPAYDNTEYLPMNSGLDDPDPELMSFSDRFRAMFMQVARETEEALAFARSDDTMSSKSSAEAAPSPPPKDHPEQDIQEAHRQQSYDYEYEEDDFYYGASSSQNLGSHSYSQPYPEDEHVRMLNAYIRRMPTIESMGSKEWRSSFGASSRNTDRHANNSRPPTGNARLSFAETELSLSGSEPRSRSNSLSAQAELLVGLYGRAQASEIGEILRRGDTIRMVEQQQCANDDASDALGDDFSLTSGSKGTANSYHTASTNSKSSGSRNNVANVSSA